MKKIHDGSVPFNSGTMAPAQLNEMQLLLIRLSITPVFNKSVITILGMNFMSNVLITKAHVWGKKMLMCPVG